MNYQPKPLSEGDRPPVSQDPSHVRIARISMLKGIRKLGGPFAAVDEDSFEHCPELTEAFEQEGKITVIFKLLEKSRESCRHVLVVKINNNDQGEPDLTIPPTIEIVDNIFN